MDEFEKWMKYVDSTTGLPTWGEVKEKYRAFKAKDKAVEPLAVLAFRKGLNSTTYWPYMDGSVEINLRWFKLHGKTWEVFNGETVAAAEAKARAYIEALPDKGDGV